MSTHHRRKMKNEAHLQQGPSTVNTPKYLQSHVNSMINPSMSEFLHNYQIFY